MEDQKEHEMQTGILLRLTLGVPIVRTLGSIFVFHANQSDAFGRLKGSLDLKCYGVIEGEWKRKDHENLCGGLSKLWSFFGSLV